MSTATRLGAGNGESGPRWVASAYRRDAMLDSIAELLLVAAAIAVGGRVVDIVADPERERSPEPRASMPR